MAKKDGELTPMMKQFFDLKAKHPDAVLLFRCGDFYETYCEDAVTAPRKPRLYDPDTGEYLNDETMQAIEDVRSGKDKGTTYESFEDFKKTMLAL